MRIQRIVPDLTATDLHACARQHAAVLGLEVVMDNGWIVILADSEGHQLILMTRDETGPVNPDVSAFVDDVEAAYAAAQEAGVEIVHSLRTEDWGVRRFFYRDASGHVINVGQHV
jgi:uncharacterized glyoxalase superfamily protein PhnB